MAIAPIASGWVTRMQPIGASDMTVEELTAAAMRPAPRFNQPVFPDTGTTAVMAVRGWRLAAAALV